MRRQDEEFAAVEERARAALKDLAATGDFGEAGSAKHMRVLQEYRQACHERARYVEADLAQQVLRHMRLDEETRHVRGLTVQQLQERHALVTAHSEEFNEFNRAWNEKIDEFEEQQLKLETELLERQNAELQSFYEEINEMNPRVAKCSRKLLDARAVEHILATQREYVRAQKVKVKADRLEAQDTERFFQAKVGMFERREELLRQKHEQEKNVLITKIERRRNELERQRKKELDVLLRKYVNIKRELELQQNIIRSKTGTILLKHANNTKSDCSGSAALVESAGSGAFGVTVRRRHLVESNNRTLTQTVGSFSELGVSCGSGEKEREKEESGGLNHDNRELSLNDIPLV